MNPSAEQNTQTIRQCPTKTGPVARYVVNPINIEIRPIVTEIIRIGTISTDVQDNAEQDCLRDKKKWSQAEQDQAEQDRVQPTTLAPALSPAYWPITRGQENARGQEIGLEQEWRILRISRLFLKENAEGWKCLTAKEMKDLEKEEKIMRMKLKENKRRKFWKAGNTKLTAMDEENLRMEIVKMKEMTEVEQNIWK